MDGNEKKLLTGTTSGGFQFEIDPRITNDMVLVEELAEADKDVTKFPGVLKKILGEEQKGRLYDFIKTEDGLVPVDKCVAIFTEIMDLASEETKNS